jgi:hypothetical protein
MSITATMIAAALNVKAFFLFYDESHLLSVVGILTIELTVSPAVKIHDNAVLNFPNNIR